MVYIKLEEKEMKKKTILLMVILGIVVIGTFFAFFFQEENMRNKEIASLLELNVEDTTNQHIQNMSEKYQLSNTYILYLAGDEERSTTLFYVDRKTKEEKALLKDVLRFVELDDKIYYSKLEHDNEIDGGIYCYDILSGDNKIIVSPKNYVQWFSVYSNKLVFVFQNGIGTCDVQGGKIEKILDYQPNLPFDAAILKDHIVICQEGGKIELVSLCEKKCWLLMERDAMSLDTIACIGEDIYIGMNAYTIGSSYNTVKKEKSWNGIWKFSLSDWEAESQSAMIKISDDLTEKLFVFENNLYKDNNELVSVD